MHVRIYLKPMFFVFLMCCAASAQEITEGEAVRLFLTGSTFVQEARATTPVVEAQTRSWHVWPNPQIGFEHEGAGLTQITSIQQSLPINGRFGLLREAGSVAVKAASAQAEFAAWNLCSNMRDSFYRLVLAQHREVVLANNLSKLQEVVRILREREKHGEGSRFDVLRGEQEEAELQAEIKSAQAVIAESKSELAAFLYGSTNSSSFLVRGDFLFAKDLPPVDELMRLALENRQDYRGEKQREQQFYLEERAASRMRIPDPAIFAGLKRAEDSGGIRYGPHIGISVSVPIFERGQNRVAEMQAEIRRSSYRQEVLIGQIESEVRGAYEELLLRRQAEAEYRSLTEQSSNLLEQIASLAYQEGELGILELLDAYRVRRFGALRLLELAAASKQAEIALERAIGKPILNPEVLP